MPEGMDQFVYKLPGHTGGARSGAHRSRSRGSGMSFAGHARLFDQPDPRRLDLRASLADVNGDWLVRTYLQRSTLSIKAVVDLSASMHFGSPGKLAIASSFLQALGNSAQGYGDAVSLLTFDERFREELFMPPRTGRGLAMAMASILDTCMRQPAKAGDLHALSQTLDHIAGTADMIFIVSDMHWPLEALHPLLHTLGESTIIPIVIWDREETTPPEAGQLLPMRDSETGKLRRLWLNHNSRKRWLNHVAARRHALIGAFDQHGIKPFFINGPFDAEQLSRYFMEEIAL